MEHTWHVECATLYIPKYFHLVDTNLSLETSLSLESRREIIVFETKTDFQIVIGDIS